MILPSEIQEVYECGTYGIIKGIKVNVEKKNEKYYFVITADCEVAEILGKNDLFVSGNGNIHLNCLQYDVLSQL